MTMVLARGICIAIGYCLGMFQTGYIYGKLHHVDIRQHGSGNAGATNTLRTASSWHFIHRWQSCACCCLS